MPVQADLSTHQAMWFWRGPISLRISGTELYLNLVLLGSSFDRVVVHAESLLGRWPGAGGGYQRGDCADSVMKLAVAGLGGVPGSMAARNSQVALILFPGEVTTLEGVSRGPGNSDSRRTFR